MRALALSLSLLAAVGPPRQATLTLAKWDQIEQAIRGQRGKVVLVYFWANYSVPDKVGIGRLVALHRRLAPDGLAILTVSVDARTPRGRERVLTFLTRMQATFPNFLLDDSVELLGRKLGIIPAGFAVYDRGGKRVLTVSATDPTPTEVEQVVSKLLRTAPER